MTEREKQKLNEKLAKWAGFFRLGRYWAYPEEGGTNGGEANMLLPNFTDSLDACIKWLVPKLQDMGIYWELHQGVGYCPMAKLFWNKKAFWLFTNLKWIFMSEETPALAFCIAIEKLIDSKS